jgi:hypothetical protein
VLIGRHLDRAQLRSRLEACLTLVPSSGGEMRNPEELLSTVEKLLILPN